MSTKNKTKGVRNDQDKTHRRLRLRKLRKEHRHKQ